MLTFLRSLLYNASLTHRIQIEGHQGGNFLLFGIHHRYPLIMMIIGFITMSLSLFFISLSSHISHASGV